MMLYDMIVYSCFSLLSYSMVLYCTKLYSDMLYHTIFIVFQMVSYYLTACCITILYVILHYNMLYYVTYTCHGKAQGSNIPKAELQEAANHSCQRQLRMSLACICVSKSHFLGDCCWVAVREFKLSYHNMDVHTCIYAYIAILWFQRAALFRT